jgi:hypothetical protein
VSGFVLESPGELSGRAIAFLRDNARRTSFEQGLVGDELREEIRNVYGEGNEPIVALLERLQIRFGGLAYESGFFQANVEFAPVCEPDEADEELEILYAVETASPAGASVKSNGDVEVGIDGSGIIEFSSLDALIECDSMLDLMRRFSVESREYLNPSQVPHIVDVLHSDAASGLGFVPEASGKHCHWFDSDAIAVLVCGTWAELGSVMNPVLRIWSDSRDAIERVKRLIA